MKLLRLHFNNASKKDVQSLKFFSLTSQQHTLMYLNEIFFAKYKIVVKLIHGFQHFLQRTIRKNIKQIFMQYPSISTLQDHHLYQ